MRVDEGGCSYLVVVEKSHFKIIFMNDESMFLIHSVSHKYVGNTQMTFNIYLKQHKEEEP